MLFADPVLQHLILGRDIVPHLPTRGMIARLPAFALSSAKISSPAKPTLFGSWRHESIMRQNRHAHLDGEFGSTLSNK
jgi:hypothetical protein